MFHLTVCFYVYNDISYLFVLGCSGGERKIAEPKEKDAKRILKYKMNGSGAKKDTKKYPKNMKKSKKIEPFASFNISSFKYDIDCFVTL